MTIPILAAVADTKPCETCGKSFQRNPADGPRRWASRAFCSISCSRRQRKPKGYRRVGGERLHRIVMAAKLGRALRCGERVCFVNGDRTDVRPENLELLRAISDEPVARRMHDHRQVLPAGILRCGHKLTDLEEDENCGRCPPRERYSGADEATPVQYRVGRYALKKEPRGLAWIASMRERAMAEALAALERLGEL